MSKKTTKRALAMSFVSVFLCVCMLVGTTFAWFTDSVTSSNNKIQAGTLDIKMSYLAPHENSSTGGVWENFRYYYAYPNDAQWVDVESANAQPIFNYQKWEPGYTDCAYLMIENEGNLNLKYSLNVVPTGEVGKLAEVIDVYYQVYYKAPVGNNKGQWMNADNQKATPDNIWYKEKTAGAKYAGTLQDIIDGKFTLATDQMLYSNEFTVKYADQVQGMVYYAIALHMREDAGNEYQNQSIGDAFDVRLLATQAIGETDMYTNDYDAKAEYPNVVGSAAELSDALANGKDAVLSGDIVDAPVNTKAPYGNYYGVALNGGVLDGNGNSLDFNEGELNNGSLDNYGIMVSAGTIKNVDITGVFRGIVIMNPTDDIYIDNVTIGGEDVCYAINTAEGDGTHSLIVTNSTIAGWNSYGTAIKDLSFTDCTFAQGEYYTNVYGRLVKPYVTTVFENCEFSSKYYIDLSALEDGCTITLKNCTVNGVKLTAENWKDLIVAEDACGNGQISIEGKDGTYMSTSNIFDYVVID